MLSPAAESPTDDLRRRFDRVADRNGLARFTWTAHGRLTTGVSHGTSGWVVQCRSSRRSSLVAIGCARLDNRDEVGRWSAAPERWWSTASDLDLVLHAVDARGTRCIPHLLGDFAFVIWDAHEQALIAARDALGVRPLFKREEAGRVLLSTRAALLVPENERFDLEFIADYLVGGQPPGRTVYAGVGSVPPGSIVRWRCESSSVERYWSVEEFEVDERMEARPAEQSEAFRTLFAQSVRTCLDGRADVWSQLSGGLDSSSIVSMAQWLAEAGVVPYGVAGTVTHVPGMGGDEREYSHTVVERYRVRNEVLSGYWMLQDDGSPPPLTDLPYPAFPMYARDRRSVSIVREGGGRVLLTGHGSDQYLTGNRYFLADYLAKGQLRRLVRETIRWSVAERRSVWRTGFQFAVVPHLPMRLQRRFAKGGAIPDWIVPSFARRFTLRDRLPLVRQFAVAAGRKFDGPSIAALAHSSSGPAGGVTNDLLEARHPFLHRPLVEFGLRLPPFLRIRPRTTKWIQREALRDILPEPIRMRHTKGAIDGRLEWSLARERQRIDRLLERSLLAELGCIDVMKVRRALEAARGGDSPALGAVVPLLSLESWLHVRTGRWSLGMSHDHVSTPRTTLVRPPTVASQRR
jgi:asparagine synthase (glutamine-hydrolysing)